MFGDAIVTIREDDKKFTSLQSFSAKCLAITAYSIIHSPIIIDTAVKETHLNSASSGNQMHKEI